MCDMESVKPETVIEILKKHNVHISLAQAQLILIFTYKLAKVTLTKTERT
jgi:hypothetical protein